jgi:hypothetical protein
MNARAPWTRLALLLALPALAVLIQACADAKADSRDDDERIRIGLDIAPVALDLSGKDRDLVGLGSYIVNAQGGCNDCHSCPSYAPGQNPYDGKGDGRVNASGYLAGGVPFGPFIRSANITPDGSGRPAGLTFEAFRTALRTGNDPEDPSEKLQVMPWPVFRNMSDHDLQAIYEFLRAIPHAEPGSCTGAGE